MTVAMTGELGEFANLVKKVARGSMTMEEARQGLSEELTDVFIYMMNIVGILGIDLTREYNRKRQTNVRRFGKTSRPS
jgi:NTP pyrophosphatase (non-canonical NTP hydrolase)